MMLFKTLPTTPKLISHTKHTKTQGKKLSKVQYPMSRVISCHQTQSPIILPETRNPKPETQNTKHLRFSAAPCDKNGFTLIELIVSILIFGILSVLLFSTFIQIQRNINKNTWKNQLTEEGVNTCDKMRMELTGAREIHYADQDSISFINQEGKLSSFCWKDSLLFKSNRNIVPTDIKVTSFRFLYYLPSDIIGESSEPIYFLPVEPMSLKRLKVVDWEIGIKKGKTTINLKTGVFIRSIR